MVESWPCSVEVMGLISARETGTPHSGEQVSLCPTTLESVGHNYRVHASQQKMPHDPRRILCVATKTWNSQIISFLKNK